MIRDRVVRAYVAFLAMLAVLTLVPLSFGQEPGLVQITNYPGEDAEGPRWSPDGKVIAFISNRGSGNGRVRDMWSVAPDGSNVNRLTVFPDDGYDSGINANASGPWIGSTGDLLVYDTDQLWEWLRFELSQNPPLPVQRNVLDGPSSYFTELLVIPGGLGGDSFDVSQDGQSAGWSVRTGSSCPFSSGAYVAPFSVLNGQQANQVGTVLASGTINCPYTYNDPIKGMSYSPDASQVVLARVPDPNYLGWNLEVYNSGGGLARNLTNNGGGPTPVSNWNPRWSPDGTRIAFASNASGEFQIYTIQTDGSNLTQVTTGGGDWPTWSPDSSRIAFESSRGGNSEIYSISLLGNGLDTGGQITDQDKFWQSAKASGIDFAVLEAWGGGPSANPYVQANVLGAQKGSLATAAYILLNYFQDQTGTWQVDQALAAIGSEAQTGLKFIAVDVEDCCGEFVKWKASHKYTQVAGNDSITDPASHIQVVVTAGKSGATQPTWNDSGGLTHDGTVVWKDEHVFVQGEIVQWITVAVNEISKNHLTPIIYTTREKWKGFTGGCNSDLKGANNCSNLISLKLWDAEPPCGDKIVGLTGFKRYPTPVKYGWQYRSGNQYQCEYNGFPGTAVDLDYFDPNLFK